MLTVTYRVARFLIVLFVIGIAPVAVAQEEATSGDEFEPGRVLAIVGGEPIFVGDILFEVNQLITKFMPQAPRAAVERERPNLVLRMLPKYIDQKLLLVDAKNGLPEGADFEDVIESASSEFDEKALDELMKGAGVNSPVEFDAHLRAQGSSLRKLRRTWTTNQVVRYLLTQKIRTDIQISHKELLDYYREHEADYAFKGKARWEQVMVRLDRFSSKADAMTAIVEMGNKIVYGASFDGVAKKSSQGFRASSGGQHDWTTQGSLVLKELDEAIFSLPVGQLSDVIKTKQGYHIIRVIERKEAGKVDFLEAQVEIRKTLEAERQVAAFEDHIAMLKKTIPVEVIGGSVRSASHSEPESSGSSLKR